jgi:hypothetical protein
MRPTLSWFLALLLLAGVTACGDDDERIPSDETTKEAGTDGPADGTTPPGHPPVTGTLKYAVPGGWSQVGGRTDMRVATWEIPAADGAEGKAQVVLYWSPGGMGGKDENLQRWAASIVGEDGKPSAVADAKLEDRVIHGLKVTTLQLDGTYRSTMMGGAHGTGAIEDARLYCAFVAVPGGSPYYLKAYGPIETMKSAHDAFEQFVTSFRIE